MEESSLVKIVAIVSLTVISVSALSRGMDSVLIGSISAIIGGIAGYEIKRNKDAIKRALRGVRK
jgi:hypothetical protein